mmetsp:Transcript_15747/g.42938  ORF Transcript_15747/g.42938 Transcript_15747/m.42938 type:complete len:206 (-) Transcript_15747:11-628(-)
MAVSRTDTAKIESVAMIPVESSNTPAKLMQKVPPVQDNSIRAKIQVRRSRDTSSLMILVLKIVKHVNIRPVTKRTAHSAQRPLPTGGSTQDKANTTCEKTVKHRNGNLSNGKSAGKTAEISRAIRLYRYCTIDKWRSWDRKGTNVYNTFTSAAHNSLATNTNPKNNTGVSFGVDTRNSGSSATGMFATTLKITRNNVRRNGLKST